jgi:hypothetical protein
VAAYFSGTRLVAPCSAVSRTPRASVHHGPLEVAPRWVARDDWYTLRRLPQNPADNRTYQGLLEYTPHQTGGPCRVGPVSADDRAGRVPGWRAHENVGFQVDAAGAPQAGCVAVPVLQASNNPRRGATPAAGEKQKFYARRYSSTTRAGDSRGPDSCKLERTS